MLNKRLLGLVPESRKYIIANVVLQWIALTANILAMWSIAAVLAGLFVQEIKWSYAGVIVVAVLIKSICIKYAGQMRFLSAKEVKKKIRDMLYRKVVDLGTSYQEHTQTSDIVQCVSEGAEQLEAYFGSYVPQLFYALAASFTVFGIIAIMNLGAAILLLLCIPLIPISIVLVQKFAKKLLAKYWAGYTQLGDTFLDNLRGLVTAKLYCADERKHREMNEQSEQFRKVTMRVLSMQLNSIIVMDLIAYGGAALGMIASLQALQVATITPALCIFIILLSADFFLPLRALGSFFHTAMNGMAAAERIFRILDIEIYKGGNAQVCGPYTIKVNDLSFAYDPEYEILHHIHMTFPTKKFTAVVGASGCGKSTLAALIMGKYYHYTGDIQIGDQSMRDCLEHSILEHITYVSHQNVLMKGTVADHLRMAKADATEQEMYAVLAQVKIDDFVKENGGLAMVIEENGSNLSGGQRQRLAMARALLKDSDVYIFDEASSNIDMESEDAIMQVIQHMSGEKTVIMITHRMKNVENADLVYVMDHGSVVGSGCHEELMRSCPIYQELHRVQNDLEMILQGGVA